MARSKQRPSSPPLAADPRPAIFQNRGILEEKIAGFKAEMIVKKSRSRWRRDNFVQDACCYRVCNTPETENFNQPAAILRFT